MKHRYALSVVKTTLITGSRHVPANILILSSQCVMTVTVNVTHAEVEESKMYYFVYINQNGIEANFQVHMAFNTVEYFVEQTDIFQECTVSNDEDQPCFINIPIHFRGAAVLATSGPTDLPEVWKDTLPVSWQCESTINAHEIYMFVPTAIPVCLFFLWWASLLCAARYCYSSNDRIRQAKILIAVIMVVTIVVIAICFGINVLGVRKISTAISWSCDSSDIQWQVIFYVIFHIGMGLLIFVRSMQFFKQKIGPGDQPENTSDSTRQEEHQNDNSKLRTKMIIIVIVVTSMIFMSMIIAAFLTFLVAILPILTIYSPSVNVLTSGDTKIFSFENHFVSSVFVEYIGSPHLSATLYVSDEQPPLSKYTSYGTSESLLCNQSECTHIWQSYLNWNSSVNMQICLNESNSANASFCVIKGVNSATSDISQIQVQPGNTQVNCSTLTQSNQCFEWTLHIDDTHAKSDRYFFILKEYNHSIVDINLQFSRTDYSPDYTDTSKVDSCTINSHTINSCTAHLQNKTSSTALIVVTSDLDKPLFEWQDTISITAGYNYRADTWTGVCLAVFVVNSIVLSILILSYIKLRLKLLKPAKPKSDFLMIVQSGKRVSTDFKELNEQVLPLQQDSLSQNTESDGGHEQDTNEDITSAIVISVPAIETSQSLVVPVDLNPDSSANSDDEHISHENVHPSTSPVEVLHDTNIEVSCTDAKPRDVDKNITPITAMQRDEPEVPTTQL